MGDEGAIKRYEVVDCEKCGAVTTHLEPEEEGSWVLYDDYVAALRQREQEGAMGDDSRKARALIGTLPIH